MSIEVVAAPGGMVSIRGSVAHPTPVQKYDPSQPRHPKGHPLGGQWLDTGSGTALAEGARFGDERGFMTDAHATDRLQRAFPKAVVSIEHESIGPTGNHGLVTGLEKMAELFPEAAAEVSLIRVAENSTPALAEMIVVTTRHPDTNAQTTGFGILVNPAKASESGMARMESMVESGYWGDQVEHTNDFHARGNVLSLDSHSEFVQSNIIHEFGHIVHNLATAREKGMSMYDKTGANMEVWYDVLGTDASFNLKGPRSPINKALDDFYVKTYQHYEYEGDRRGIGFPSLYARKNPAETFAEAFAFRHGPPGSGLDSRPFNDHPATLDPELEAILDQAEAQVRG